MSNDVLTEWTTLKLGAVFKVKSGENLSAKKIIKGNYPVFGGNGINSYHNQFLFEDPKIVIGRVGAKCGCVYITQPKSWITDNALYIHDKIREFKDLYMYYLLDYLDLNQFANKNAQPVISGQKIYDLEIKLPPLKEQEKIADILSTVDEEIEQTNCLIEKTKELKKGLLQKLLTKGIGHQEFKETEIGEIPLDWDVKSLNELGTLKGGNGFKNIYQGHDGLNYPFYKVSDMNLKNNEIFMFDSIHTIDKKILSLLKATIFPANTIVFAKVGAALLLNRRRILTKESCIDNNMMGLTVNDKVFYKFLYYVLSTIDFGEFVNEGAVPSVNQSQIGCINIALPTLKEQIKIVEILTKIDYQIEDLLLKWDKLQLLKKGLTKKLLTGKIRVKP